MTVVHVSCDGTLEIRPKQVPPPVIGDSKVAAAGQAALAQKLDVPAMGELDLRSKILYARKGYLYFALVVVIIALIFALMFSKFFIAAGIGGGILLLLLALKVNKWQISKVESQIQLLVKAHPQNPNVLALHWGSLHSRLMRERKQEDARELAEEFFKNGDRSHENIRLFVLDLKEKGFFENEESDPMEGCVA